MASSKIGKKKSIHGVIDGSLEEEIGPGQVSARSHLGILDVTSLDPKMNYGKIKKLCFRVPLVWGSWEEKIGTSLLEKDSNSKIPKGDGG
jgi:hypothetical protein